MIFGECVEEIMKRESATRAVSAMIKCDKDLILRVIILALKLLSSEVGVGQEPTSSC